jgi:hypothetical protein
MEYVPRGISALIVMSSKIFLVNTILLWEIAIIENAGKTLFIYFL